MDQGEEIYCVCRKPAGSNRFMIQCDKCDCWFHGSCVKVTKSKTPHSQWFCPPCSGDTQLLGKQNKNVCCSRERTGLEKQLNELKNTVTFEIVSTHQKLLSVNAEVQSLKIQVSSMQMQNMEKTGHREKELEDMLKQKEKQLQVIYEQRFEEGIRQKEKDLKEMYEQKYQEKIKQIEKNIKNDYDLKAQRFYEEWKKTAEDVDMEYERKLKEVTNDHEITVKEMKEEYEQKLNELEKTKHEMQKIIKERNKSRLSLKKPTASQPSLEN